MLITREQEKDLRDYLRILLETEDITRKQIIHEMREFRKDLEKENKVE